MPDTKIDLVIFDMDGVLNAYDLNIRLQRLSAITGKLPEAIHAAVWESDLEDRSDNGKISAQEYLEEWARRVGAPITRAEWILARRVAMTPSRPVLSMVAKLKQKTAVAMLTNNGFILKETLDDIFPELASLFGDKLHVVAEFGTRKPEPEVYRRLTAFHGIDPHAAMMIDDKPENVEGAERAGLKGYLFDSADGLMKKFIQLGLLETK